MAEQRSIGRDIVQGAIAGAAATWVMGCVTSYMYEHESPEARRQYEEVTGGKSVPDRSAEKIESAWAWSCQRKNIRRLPTPITGWWD